MVILECLLILHRLILTSKVAEENAFLEYVKAHYLSFFQENLELGNERYEYSLFKIEQILEEIKNLIPTQQMCEVYWQRMVKLIKEGDIKNNKLVKLFEQRKIIVNEDSVSFSQDYLTKCDESETYSRIKEISILISSDKQL